MAGCGERRADPPVVRPAGVRATEVDEEVEAARTILALSSPAVAAEALRLLETRSYTVGVTYRELDAQGARLRGWRRTIERRPDSTRSGEETLLGEVLAGQGGALALLRYVDPIEILLPEDPPYLRPGNRDYTFRLLPDREMDGRRVRGAQAARRAGVDEPVMLVRSWIDSVTEDPVSVELVRASSSMLLTDEARVDVTLGRGEDASILPLAARVDASVQILAEPQRRFLIDMSLEQWSAPGAEAAALSQLHIVLEPHSAEGPAGFFLTLASAYCGERSRTSS
jgi:hypothetical protein